VPRFIGITFLGSSQWSIRSAQCCISFVRERCGPASATGAFANHSTARNRGESPAVQTDATANRAASESVNHELIFWQISPLGNSATQSMTSSSREKCGCTQMPISNDVASSGTLWEQLLSLLVVSASVLGGSTVLLIQVLPPLLHGIP
jgi:hypothetical protein